MKFIIMTVVSSIFLFSSATFALSLQEVTLTCEQRLNHKIWAEEVCFDSLVLLEHYEALCEEGFDTCIDAEIQRESSDRACKVADKANEDYHKYCG